MRGILGRVGDEEDVWSEGGSGDSRLSCENK